MSICFLTSLCTGDVLFGTLTSISLLFFILPPQSVAFHFDMTPVLSPHHVSPLTSTCLLSFLTFPQPHILHSALSPTFSRFSASHSSFDCQLASLATASFFDPPLLSQSFNTFNLLSSSLICHSIHPVLPFIISPYRPPPSVLLLLSACLKDGFKDPFSSSYTVCSHC